MGGESAGNLPLAFSSYIKCFCRFLWPHIKTHFLTRRRWRLALESNSY